MRKLALAHFSRNIADLITGMMFAERTAGTLAYSLALEFKQSPCHVNKLWISLWIRLWISAMHQNGENAQERAGATI